MFNYELYIDDELVRKGDETEFNAIVDSKIFGDDLDIDYITSEQDMKESVEGCAIGFFVRKYLPENPAFIDLKDMAQADFGMGAGLAISLWMEFQPRVRIEISEILN